MSLNRVEIVGGLTRDASLAYLGSSNFPVLELSVAVGEPRWNPESRREEIHTVYVSVKVPGSLAEQVAELSLSKGDEVLVLGRLAQRKIAKRSGESESKTHVEAYSVSVVRQRDPASSSRPAPARRTSDPGPSEPPPLGPDEEPF